MRKRVITVVLLCCATLAVAAENPDILIQVGAGLSLPFYPSGIQSQVSAAESQGMMRIPFCLNAAGGFEITRTSYLMLGVDALLDYFCSDGDAWEQFNSYLWYGGFRYYPLEHGIFAGAEAGGAVEEENSYAGFSSPTDWGFGLGVSIGYDFHNRNHGLYPELELKYDNLTINSQNIGMLNLLIDFCMK